MASDNKAVSALSSVNGCFLLLVECVMSGVDVVVTDTIIGLIWSNLLLYSSYLLLVSITLGASVIFIFLLACDVQSLVSSSCAD